MDNIRFIKPTDLHAEMLRLRQEQQMDFLEWEKQPTRIRRIHRVV